MSKIKSIQLNNFKFFRQSEPIVLDGKHLLLYGENGSGKSSVFWGLYTLLEAAYKQPDEVKAYFNSSDTSLVNIFASKQTDPGTGILHSDSYITIKTDNGKTFTASLLDTAICGNNDAKESRKSTDFLNYQSLFAFQHFKNSENVDLSDVFDYYILPYITFSTIRINGNDLSNAAEMWKEYQQGPSKASNGFIRNKNDFRRFESHFKNEFQKLINFINQNSYSIIKELGYDIHFILSFALPSAYIGRKNYNCKKYEIILKIDSYNGRGILINRPQTFLNEAKLTALALSIRLCVLKYRTSTLSPDALQVLILDDIMISLDMSNREMLSELLLKNSDYADKYQLLFFTHDKNLFQFIDKKIGQLNNKSNWKEIGIYVGKDSYGIEYPVIVSEEADSYSKAQKYKDAFDYETASIYIRKTLEQILNDLLPPEILKPDPNTFVSLQTLWNKFKQRYSPIDANILSLFENSKLLILNPAAHLLSKPIYKSELNRAFMLVDELKKIPSKYKVIILIEKGAKVEYKSTSTLQYLCSFNLDIDMRADRETKMVVNDPKCSNIYFEYDGIQYYDSSTNQTNDNHPLKTATPKLSRFIEGLSQAPFNITKDDFLDNATIDGTSLREYIDPYRLF